MTRRALTEARALAGPALLAGGLLVAAHRLLWGDGHTGPLWRRWGRLIAYTTGVTALNTGFTLWAAQRRDWRAAGALWLISAVGGLTVGACWLARVPGLEQAAFDYLVRQARDTQVTWQRALHYAGFEGDPAFREEVQ